AGPVVREIPADELVARLVGAHLPLVLAGELHGGFVGLRAAVDKVHVVQAAARELRQLVRQLRRGPVDLQVGVVGQLQQLLVNRVGDLPPPIAHVDAPQPGHRIQVLAPLRVHDGGAVGPLHNHQRLAVQPLVLDHGMPYVIEVQLDDFLRGLAAHVRSPPLDLMIHLPDGDSLVPRATLHTAYTARVRSTILSTRNSSRNRFRPAAPMARARSGSASASSSARASAAGSSGGTSQPSTPCRIISGRPPVSDATTGDAAAMASKHTSPCGSWRDGITVTSKPAKARRASCRNPAKCTRSATPKARACCSSWARVEPSPT